MDWSSRLTAMALAPTRPLVESLTVAPLVSVTRPPGEPVKTATGVADSNDASRTTKQSFDWLMAYRSWPSWLRARAVTAPRPAGVYSELGLVSEPSALRV